MEHLGDISLTASAYEALIMSFVLAHQVSDLTESQFEVRFLYALPGSSLRMTGGDWSEIFLQISVENWTKRSICR